MPSHLLVLSPIITGPTESKADDELIIVNLQVQQGLLATPSESSHLNYSHLGEEHTPPSHPAHVTLWAPTGGGRALWKSCSLEPLLS